MTISEEYESGLCPDCNLSIPNNAVEGDECINCGHVWWNTKPRFPADPAKYPHRSEDGGAYSDLKVMHTMAGYYLGRTFWDEKYGFEEPGSRESEYFRNEEDVMFAKLRNCPENERAYKNGLPRPVIVPTS